MVLRLPQTQTQTQTQTPRDDESLLHGKLRMLQYQYYHRPEENPVLNARRAACFWCTEAFEGAACYIPTRVDRAEGTADVYGCFCSPNCALAYVRGERLDPHVLYEREYLLHSLYAAPEAEAAEATIQPIVPAPDPRYLLSRYCGTLSIEEFRELTARGDVLLPSPALPVTVTRWFPEMPEITDERMEQYFGRSFAGFRTGARARRMQPQPQPQPQPQLLVSPPETDEHPEAAAYFVG